jgi:hypothetical protein
MKSVVFFLYMIICETSKDNDARDASNNVSAEGLLGNVNVPVPGELLVLTYSY